MKEEQKLKDRDMWIASNQIVCTACGSSVYSRYRHDFRLCKCGKSGVDGGQDYLRRVGSEWKDISITIEREALVKLVANIQVSIDSGCNSLGVASAVLRSMRDHNISQEGLSWVLKDSA